MALPALCGALALLAVSRRGVYVSHDGLAYAGIARNLLDGEGLAVSAGSPPLGNFPPLFPVVLAVAAALSGSEPLEAARWLNPVLAGATIAVAALAVRRATGSDALAAATGVLTAAATDVLAFGSSALSEPLFVLLAASGLALLAPSLRHGGWGGVAGAGLLLGAATLTRYVGVAVVGAAVLALLVLARPRRPGRALAVAGLALAPLAAWLAWVRATQGQASNRAFEFHPPGFDYAATGLRTASTWVLPAVVPSPARVAALVLIVAILVVAVVGRRRTVSSDPAGRAPAPALLALTAAAYLAVLVVDRTFFEVTGRLDRRFLLPLHVAALVAAAVAAGHSRSWWRRGWGRGAALAAALMVAAQVGSGVVWVGDALAHPDARPGGFTSRPWRHSTTLATVRALPRDITLYTNAVDVVSFLTGRRAELLPQSNDFHTGRPEREYPSELVRVRDEVGSGRAAVVYLTASPARRIFLPAPDDLEAAPGVVAVARDEVAVLLRAGG